MKTIISNNIKIYEPTNEIKDWITSNLKFKNPEFIKKQRMGFWVGNLKPNIYLYQEIPNGYVIPYGCLDKIVSMLSLGEIDIQLKDTEHIEYNSTIELFDYQREAVDILKKKYIGILQAAPGAGKTQIALQMIFEIGQRALWITHTKDLLNQSKNRALEYIDKSHIGTITEGKVNVGDITFATIQTLHSIDLSLFENMWNVIVVDECHNVSGTPTKITMYYKVLSKLCAKWKIGLSGTVHRSDGLIATTKALLGDISCYIDKENMKDRILDVGVYPVATNIEPSLRAYNTDGTLNYTSLITDLVNNEERNQLIIDTLLSEDVKPTLILTDRIEHINTLFNMLPNKIREKATFITGSTKASAREIALEEMRTGDKKILLATYSLAKEGLDIPLLSRLFLTSPHKDYAVITQAVGRIARAYPGKEKPIVVDFVDNSKYLKNSYRERIRIYKKNDCYFVEELK